MLHSIPGEYGPWPRWFEAIYDAHPDAYPDAEPRRGDICVGHLRAYYPFKHGQEMILGSEDPSEEEWETAGVAQRLGDEHAVWLSFIVLNKWYVVEVGRGTNRPWGALLRGEGSPHEKI